jgi:hypothetical protein
MGINALANVSSNAHGRLPDFMWDPATLRLMARSAQFGTMNDPCDIDLRRWGGDAPYGLGAAGLGTSANMKGMSGGAIIGQLRATPAGVPFGGDENTGSARASETGASMTLNSTERVRKVTSDGQATAAMSFEFNLCESHAHDFRRGTVRFNPEGNVQIGAKAIDQGDKSALLQIRAHEGTSSQQTITITGTPTGGTFTLKFFERPTSTGFAAGITTAGIAYNATANQVRDALVTALNAAGTVNGVDYATVVAGDITASGGPLPGTAVTLTLGGTGVIGLKPQYRMLAASSLTGGSSPTVACARANGVGLSHEKAKRLITAQHTASAAVTTPYGSGGEYFLFIDSAEAHVCRLDISGKMYLSGEMEIDGALNHDGTTVGLFGVTPATRPTAYTQTYATADKTHAAPTAATLTVTDGAGTNDNTIGAITADASVIAAVQEIADEINKLVADVADVKQLANSVIDDLQTLGILQ